MRTFHLLATVLLTALLPHTFVLAQSFPTRFPVEDAGKWGFIDSTGTVAIPLRFAQVQAFSEGLAAAREQGRYGYIDATGHFAIAPRFEAASAFHAGHAVVSGQRTGPQLIDRTGRLLSLPTTYQALEWVPGSNDAGLWLGTLKNNRQQLLSPTGQLLSAVTFGEVASLAGNRIVVKGTKPQRPLHLPGDDPEDAENYVEKPIGVLNSHGRWVIPYGRFDDISAFREGLALAVLRPNPKAAQPKAECIVDTSGRIVAYLPKGEVTLPTTKVEFSDGTAPVRLGNDPSVRDDARSYPVAIDHRGQVLFHQPSLRQLSPFEHGRAWARGEDKLKWFLLDKTGRHLNTIAITDLLSDEWPTAAPTFEGGAELVAVVDGYAAVDAQGQVLRLLPDPGFGDHEPRRAGDLLVFIEEDSTGTRAGFWNWRTGQLVPPRFTALDRRGYVHGLLAVAEGARRGYLTPAGTYAWQQLAANSTPLNLDFKRRAFYPVASPPLAKFAGYGGWATPATSRTPCNPANTYRRRP